MGSEEQAAEYFAGYGLADVPRISDPGRDLYRAFGLGTGAISGVLSPRVWLRSVSALASGHMAGIPVGDVRQMPGVFVIAKGKVIASFVHETVADRPDYQALAACGTDACSI